MKTIKYNWILKRKSDGWFYAPGGRFTSDPADALTLSKTEATHLAKFSSGDHVAVKQTESKEVV